MDWIPVVLVTFKVLVLGIGMFFAIKWHYDQGKKEGRKRASVRGVGKVAAIFALALVVVVLFTFFLGRKLGIDLRLP